MTTQTELSRIVSEIELDLIQGKKRADVMRAFADKYEVSQSTVGRWMKRADRRASKRLIRRRDKHTATAFARYEHAMDLALDAQDIVTERGFTKDEGGVPHAVTKTKWVPRPDLRAFLTANTGVCRLLGLDKTTDEQHQESMRKTFIAIAMAIDTTIEDESLRARLFERIKSIALQATEKGDAGLRGVSRTGLR